MSRADSDSRTPSGPTHPWAAVALLSVSLLMIGLDNTILNVTLPTLQRSLDASTSQLQWIVDAFMNGWPLSGSWIRSPSDWNWAQYCPVC